MPDLNKLIQTLHPLERAVIPVLENDIDALTVIRKTGMKEVEVMRALQWLENKGLVKINQTLKEIVNLDKNGALYVMEGMPEKRFLQALTEDESMTLDEIKDKAHLTKEEINICLGLLKKKGAIEILPRMRVDVTEEGRLLLGKESLEEQFLRKLPLDLAHMAKEEKYAYEELKKRKEIIKIDVTRIKKIKLTKTGEELSRLKLSDQFIDSLTQDVLSSGTWKEKNFRRYDVTINVPKIHGGRRHFVNQAVEYIKRVWLDMGFKEMKGNIVQTSFWNFDSLFTAQDHPVRDLQDTFYLKNPARGILPKKDLIDAIRKTHENGGNTGSKGWQYLWDRDESKKNVLRTHTTVLSAKTIAALKETDMPVKFFSVGKCFRNETVDWAHLFELTQVEGIVVDPNANLRHLLGYLRKFFSKMGYERIRIRPSYFPYTEPSAEIEAFHPVRKEWVELGGSGIFRPEVVKPLLGKDVPVLAWGLGMERMIGEYYNITDIRDLYRNDLRQLREMKVWMK
ncbi:phenylalanine--tRNA ligase subunit alpha [Candidatus Woesearchaeota archaeon]|nr:phenylalanine--tRNA ligase subunit alpha [Candidatus Woesearchaeota archaeon]